jgi:hypothetical protein
VGRLTHNDVISDIITQPRRLVVMAAIDEAAELLNASRPAVGSNGARAPPQKENAARWSEVSSVLSNNQV